MSVFFQRLSMSLLMVLFSTVVFSDLALASYCSDTPGCEYARRHCGPRTAPGSDVDDCHDCCRIATMAPVDEDGNPMPGINPGDESACHRQCDAMMWTRPVDPSEDDSKKSDLEQSLIR